MANLAPLVFTISVNSRIGSIKQVEAADSYAKLQKIKTALNESKSLLDKLSRDEQRAFDRFNDATRTASALMHDDGMLVQKFDAQIVTNAWLKLYELMQFIYNYPHKSAKKEPVKYLKPSTDLFETFHFAELPGNFVLAVNHYLACNASTTEWKWLAESYRQLYVGDKTKPLVDSYGLVANYPTGWCWGADGDGDISSINNIRSWPQYANSYNLDNIALVTADVKSPLHGNYDEEERINIPVQCGQILSAIFTLAPGGVAILKGFTILEKQSVSLAYLFATSFDCAYITKPHTSRAANSEMYLVGVGFRDDFDASNKEEILQLFQNSSNNGTDISIAPADFVERIVTIEQKLADRQSTALTELLASFEASKGKVSDDIVNTINKQAQDWIALNKIKSLPANKILKVNKNVGSSTHSLE